MSEVREFRVPWIEQAQADFGTEEDTDSGSNPKIIKWAKDVGGSVADNYKSDDIPWCGLFVAHVMQATKCRIDIDNPLWARDWAKFGVKCDPPRYGSILVFERGSGGHVGFYISEDDDYYHVLGGNQSDSVSMAKVAKSRLLACKWPAPWQHIMGFFKPVHAEFDGEVTENEA
jgi:uncharacterized protein (TIGR02594 family)